MISSLGHWFADVVCLQFVSQAQHAGERKHCAQGGACFCLSQPARLAGWSLDSLSADLKVSPLWKASTPAPRFPTSEWRILITGVGSFVFCMAELGSTQRPSKTTGNAGFEVVVINIIHHARAFSSSFTVYTVTLPIKNNCYHDFRMFFFRSSLLPTDWHAWLMHSLPRTGFGQPGEAVRCALAELRFWYVPKWSKIWVVTQKNPLFED